MARMSGRTSASLKEFCKYIPLRLTQEERALLTVLENTLHVSEYTDHVDVASNRRGLKARRILDGILEACHIATGLVGASAQEPTLTQVVSENDKHHEQLGKKKAKKKFRKGKKKQVSVVSTIPSSSWASRDPQDNAALFQTMCEIGRRNKVLNPSSMRTTYGKLMYLLQDSQNSTVAKSLGFSLHKDLVLVQPYLEEYEAVALLDDARLLTATQFIAITNERGRRLEREEIGELVEEKRRAVDALLQEYSSPKLSESNVKRVIDSIADAIAYVESNVAPVKRMLQYLEENFDPREPKGKFSLQLSGSSRPSYSSYGQQYTKYGMSAFRNDSSGATLSHSHSTQFTFVWQSLRLWMRTQENMHRLWLCADEDLLSTGTAYHLYNTGQGLNRVQSCPRVAKVMRSLLSATQQEAGSPWVGLSVIHLGDRDVPNALMFIDKYTQIPRFLHPVVEFLDGLEEMCRDECIGEYVKKQFQSSERLKMIVLTDWCKHSFDGSGDDGGSCIDGRIT
jgi:hypothetical protein